MYPLPLCVTYKISRFCLFIPHNYFLFWPTLNNYIFQIKPSQKQECGSKFRAIRTWNEKVMPFLSLLSCAGILESASPTFCFDFDRPDGWISFRALFVLCSPGCQLSARFGIAQFRGLQLKIWAVEGSKVKNPKIQYAAAEDSDFWASYGRNQLLRKTWKF